MANQLDENRYSGNALIKNVQTVLKGMEREAELFDTLLLSYPQHLQALLQSHTTRASH